MICFAIPTLHPVRGRAPRAEKRRGWPWLLRREDRENLVLTHDEVVLTVDLDFLSGILPEEDRVPILYVEGLTGAVILHLAGAHGEHLPLLRLFFGAVGDDDAADFLFTFLDALNDDAVV